MKIGVIQASSQASKNSLIYNTVRKYAPDAEVINFGCTEEEQERYSYIEISLLAGMLLASGAVDFIVTGCSSGQGMMLACNSFPGVLCGYAPTPADAYLFAQINNGNAVSLPLGEEYTWTGEENFEATIARLFSEPFGQGWPKGESARKLRDTELLKSIRRSSQVSPVELLSSLDKAVVESILRKQNVVRYILEHGNEEIKNTIQNYEFRIQN
jgi:ribose 5-phosphate isomerase RpiB